MKNKKNLETKLEMPLGRPMDFFKGIVNGWRICYTLTEEEREKYYPKTKTEFVGNTIYFGAIGVGSLVALGLYVYKNFIKK